MSDELPPPERPLVEIPDGEVGDLITLALTLTKGGAGRDAVARDAFRAVADRLAVYFKASGLVLMRPAPMPPKPAPEMRPFRLPLKD